MAGSPGGLNATVQGVHQNVPLSDLTLMWRPTGGVADQLFPIKQVMKESDNYYVWNKGQRFRVLRSDGYGSLKADRTEAKTRNYGFTESSYRTFKFAIAESVSDRERENADASLSLEQSKILGIQDELMLDYELRVAGIATNAANYASSHKVTNSGTSQWNNASFASLGTTGSGHSAIKAQIDAGKQAIVTDTGGLLPNTIVIPYQVAIVLNNDPGLADMEKFTLNRLLEGDLLDPANQQLKFMGMRVLMPTITYQSTVEGEADSIGYVWGKNVVMAYVNPAPALNSLTFGLTFRKDAFGIRSWREESTEETVYEVSVNQTEKLVAADCAYLISAAIA